MSRFNEVKLRGVRPETRVSCVEWWKIGGCGERSGREIYIRVARLGLY